MEVLILVLSVLGGAAAGAIVALVIRNTSDKSRLQSARNQAEQIVETAGKEAENSKREALLEARDEALAAKQKNEAEAEKRFEEIRREEKRVSELEITAERHVERSKQRERELKERDRVLRRQEKTVTTKEEELDALIAERQEMLQRLAGKTAAQALEELQSTLVDKARADSATMVKDILDEARESANREAKELIVNAIYRSAAEHTAEVTVYAISLPNDEIKGRIIGREGRNIRALEAATGVDIIVDDTPETVVVSCFDPVRRELGRMVLEKLVSDGRIHPGRIEEVVEK
ncbi:MAG TPA: DUF3552 domain-containing protein, partial [Bacteroidetes bacterium]|nr:DUF3552 domain-containing protein [Bacteroidota bacterium]HEX03618.1 DUF3552 domain-containing protein [Bacteroidota bacterium]